jgi:uncharacterized membrane protein
MSTHALHSSGDSLPASLPAEQQSIADLLDLEQREKKAMGFSDRIASLVTAIVGSMFMVWANLVCFVLWIGLHTLGLVAFDPYPFGLLTTAVSLEAIFFSLFVLIAQNRQALVADKRAKIDLEVNLISEREVTKLIEMVQRLEQRFGGSLDVEAEHMRRPTHVLDLADHMDGVEAGVDPASSRGPRSASDTEA